VYFSAKRGRRLENTFKLKLISLQKKSGPHDTCATKKNNGDEKKIISMKQVFVTASVEAIQV